MLSSPLNRDRKRGRPPNSPIKTKSSSSSDFSIAKFSNNAQKAERQLSGRKEKKSLRPKNNNNYGLEVSVQNIRMVKLQKKLTKLHLHVSELNQELKEKEVLQKQLIVETALRKKLEKKLKNLMKNPEQHFLEENQSLNRHIQNLKENLEGLRADLRKSEKQAEAFRSELIDVKVILNYAQYTKNKMEIVQPIDFVLFNPAREHERKKLMPERQENLPLNQPQPQEEQCESQIGEELDQYNSQSQSQSEGEEIQSKPLLSKPSQKKMGKMSERLEEIPEQPHFFENEVCK